MIRRPPRSTLFPDPALVRSQDLAHGLERGVARAPPPQPLERDAGEPRERLLHLADAAPREVPHRLAHPVEDLLQEVAVLLEVALTLQIGRASCRERV